MNYAIKSHNKFWLIKSKIKQVLAEMFLFLTIFVCRTDIGIDIMYTSTYSVLSLTVWKRAIYRVRLTKLVIG